jgi:hypothetical protein
LFAFSRLKAEDLPPAYVFFISSIGGETRLKHDRVLAMIGIILKGTSLEILTDGP